MSPTCKFAKLGGIARGYAAEEGNESNCSCPRWHVMSDRNGGTNDGATGVARVLSEIYALNYTTRGRICTSGPVGGMAALRNMFAEGMPVRW